MHNIERRYQNQDPGKCEVCGLELPLRCLEEHHVIPRSQGGTNNKENKMLLCPTHHKLAHYLYLSEEKVQEMTREKLISYLRKRPEKKIREKIEVGFSGVPRESKVFFICDRWGRFVCADHTKRGVWSILSHREKIHQYGADKILRKKGYKCFHGIIVHQGSTEL